MPFTHGWSDTIPTDPSAANTLGAEIRNLRLDIHERMSAALITDWTTDPLVVLPAIKGNLDAKSFWIHHSAFKASGAVGVVTADSVTAGAGLPTFWAPVIVPLGVTITNVDALLDRTGFGNIVVKLRHRNVIAHTITDDANTTVSTGTGETSYPILSGGSIVTAILQMYFIEITPSFTNHAIFGVDVVY